jgi:hypothetical protein
MPLAAPPNPTNRSTSALHEDDFFDFLHPARRRRSCNPSPRRRQVTLPATFRTSCLLGPLSRHRSHHSSHHHQLPLQNYLFRCPLQNRRARRSRRSHTIVLMHALSDALKPTVNSSLPPAVNVAFARQLDFQRRLTVGQHQRSARTAPARARLLVRVTSARDLVVRGDLSAPGPAPASAAVARAQSDRTAARRSRFRHVDGRRRLGRRMPGRPTYPLRRAPNAHSLLGASTPHSGSHAVVAAAAHASAAVWPGGARANKSLVTVH